MSGGRRGLWIAAAVSAVVLVVGIVGIVGTAVLNSSVFGKIDAYGVVPVPGSASLELPAGDVQVNYRYTMSTSGSSSVIPMLHLGVEPPAGVEKPTITETGHSSSTSGREVTASVFVVHVAQAGVYKFEVGEPGFRSADAELLFGYEGPYGWLIGVFVGVTVLGAFAVVGTIIWALKSGSNDDEPGYAPNGIPGSSPNYAPPGQDPRLERLKMIAGLRDSGALSEAEFQAEKRRILGS